MHSNVVGNIGFFGHMKALFVTPTVIRLCGNTTSTKLTKSAVYYI